MKTFGLVVRILVIGASLCLLGFGFYMWEFGRNFMKSGQDLRDPTCHIHESNRIEFHLKSHGLDLNRMLDSFKNINKQFKLPDSLSMMDLSTCQCCCISDDKEIYFDKSPTEIYWLTISRYRFNAGFEGQHTEDILYVDVVSSFKNDNWRCALTSKLDSSEKKRIRNRINNEIASRLPMIKDTSAHKDEDF